MIQNLFWKFFGKKYALGGFVTIYKFFNGYKTQICTALTIIVYAAKTFGFLEAGLADNLILLLSGAGGVTIMHKLQKLDEDYKIQQRAAELRAEAHKILQENGVINPPLPPKLK